MIEGWKETELGLIPDKWEQSILSVYAEKPQYGFTDSSSNSGNAKFLRITDITDTGVNWNDVPYCNCPDIEKYKLVNGDIVFARIGATTGKSYIISNPPKAVFASYLIRVRTNAELLSNYLIYFFKSEYYWKQINSQKGTNLKGGVNGSILSELKIIVPPLPEQRKIAYILNTVQKVIEQQDKLIKATTELKKALMQKLFTEGTRGEKQKQTEIGLVPESWEVVELGTVLVKSQYGMSSKGSENGNIPILRMTNQKDGYTTADNLQFVNITPSELKRFKVDFNDVIFNRTNSFELVGRTAIFKLHGDYVFASYLIRLITDKNKLLPEFLNVYLNADETQQRLKSIATRGVSQSNISATRLSSFQIPLPDISIQSVIIEIVKVFDIKIFSHKKNKQTLTDLFKTLLHELMTGQRRVNEIEFEMNKFV